MSANPDPDSASNTDTQSSDSGDEGSDVSQSEGSASASASEDSDASSDESSDEATSDDGSSAESAHGEDEEEEPKQSRRSSTSRKIAEEEVEHVRAQIVDIVKKKDASKLGHVDKLIKAYATGSVAFEKLSAKMEQQFGAQLVPYEAAAEDAAAAVKTTEAAPEHEDGGAHNDDRAVSTEFDDAQIEEIRLKLTAIVMEKKPKKKKMIPKLMAALAAKELSFAELQSNVEAAFKATLADPRQSRSRRQSAATPTTTVLAQEQTGIRTLDIDKVADTVRELLQQHDPAKVGRVKKFASALRSGKLSAQQLVEEFKKQYNAELDLTHCYVTKSAASATAAGSASERGADEVNFEWIEKELTRIITEHDPDNLKGVKKLVSRLKSGKMPFNKVQKLVHDQYGAELLSCDPSSRNSAPKLPEPVETDHRVETQAQSPEQSSSGRRRSRAGSVREAASSQSEDRVSTPHRKIEQKHIDSKITSQKFAEYFRLNLGLFAKLTKAVPRYLRAIDAFLANEIQSVVDTRAAHVKELNSLVAADRSAPEHIQALQVYGQQCASRSLFNETHLEKMLRDLHGSLVEFKPYHESTVTNLNKRIQKRLAAIRKFEQCSAAYDKELKKAQGQSKGNSFVAAEDDPTVIERLEEKNNAQYLLEEEHKKLLEQISVLKNRHEALVSLHLRTFLAREVSTSSTIFGVVSELVMKPLQDRQIQDFFAQLGSENRGEFGDLVVDPGKTFFDAEIKFWRDYLRIVQAFQRALPGLLKNIQLRAKHVMTYFAELHTFVEPIQLHTETAHALAETQKHYAAIQSSGFFQKFSSDTMKTVERLRSSAADLISHLTQFIPRRRNLCGKLQRLLKRSEQEIARAKKKSGQAFDKVPQVVKVQAEVDATQAELQSQVANMAAMVRQMHCHREKHLSTQISGLLEFEMQTCGSLYTGLDYILQKHS